MRPVFFNSYWGCQTSTMGKLHITKKSILIYCKLTMYDYDSDDPHWMRYFFIIYMMGLHYIKMTPLLLPHNKCDREEGEYVGLWLGSSMRCKISVTRRIWMGSHWRKRTPICFYYTHLQSISAKTYCISSGVTELKYSILLKTELDLAQFLFFYT